MGFHGIKYNSNFHTVEVVGHTGKKVSWYTHTPLHIVNCWAPILHLLQGHPEFQTFDGLKEFYKSKVPSSKKLSSYLNVLPI
jgi:hypothetical protein